MSSQVKKDQAIKAMIKQQEKEILADTIVNPLVILTRESNSAWYEATEYANIQELKKDIDDIKEGMSLGDVLMICEVRKALVVTNDGDLDDILQDLGFVEEDEDGEELEEGETATDYKCPVCTKALVWDMNEGCYLCKNCDKTFTYDMLQTLEEEEQIDKTMAKIVNEVGTASKE